MSIWRHLVQRLQLTRPRLGARRASLRMTAPVYRITETGQISLKPRLPYRRLVALLLAVVMWAGGAAVVVFL